MNIEEAKRMNNISLNSDDGFERILEMLEETS